MFQARFWRAGLSLMAALLTSCVQAPDSYPVPEQHLPFRSNNTEFMAPEIPSHRNFSYATSCHPMADAGAGRPRSRNYGSVLQSNQNRKLLFEFVINERTFRDTGPVTISFFVNKRLIGRETYESPGDKKLRETRTRRVDSPKRRDASDGAHRESLAYAAGRSGHPSQASGIRAVKPLSIFLSALFTVATAESLGLLLLQRLRIRFTRRNNTCTDSCAARRC